jgi:hypothetical protein
MLARLTLLTVLALLSGAALADEHGDAAAEAADESKAEERVCFNRRQVNSFDGLSDRHVYIKEGTNNYYLLTMRNRCTGLRDANGIAIKDTMSRICANSFAEIMFRDMGRVQRCRIGDIERVENKDEAKALVAERENHEKHEKKDKD